MVDFMRQVLSRPSMGTVKHTVRHLQALLDYDDFRRIKYLLATLPLGYLLERQPRFRYKYLSRYTAASFSRSERLQTLLNHYLFLQQAVGPDFFEALPGQPTLWQEQRGTDVFRITLSYPPQVGFECELSLNFMVNATTVQVLGFVLVPGQMVGATSRHALFFSQVQGGRDAVLLRHTTRALHDITPAALLVNAAYGLAAALGIGQAVGISCAEQLSAGQANFFNYDAFWAQFKGERTAQGLFLLAIPAPERPIGTINSSHRARTLRKRHYKQRLRAAVEQHFRATYLRGGVQPGG